MEHTSIHLYLFHGTYMCSYSNASVTVYKLQLKYYVTMNENDALHSQDQHMNISDHM